MRCVRDHEWNKKMDVEGDGHGLFEDTVMTLVWTEYGNKWGRKRKEVGIADNPAKI